MTDFKKWLIKKIKVCGQMMIDMAEDIAGETDLVAKLTVTADDGNHHRRDGTQQGGRRC